MKYMPEIHVTTKGSPVFAKPTALATDTLKEVLTAIVATEGTYAYDIAQNNSETLNANYYGTKVTDLGRIGACWQLDGQPSCYQIMDDSLGDNYIICMYPDGQVAVLFSNNDGMAAYLADGHQW